MEMIALNKHTTQLTELLSRIQSGDPIAERQLLHDYSILEKVRMIVARKVFNGQEDRHDLTMEIVSAFILALRNGMFCPERGNIGGYLWGIASNRISKFLRRKERDSIFQPLPAEPVVHECHTEEKIRREEMRARFRKAIAKLDRRYQEVIILRYYEGASIRDISDQLQISERKVYNRIHYALRLLATLV